MHVKSMLVLFFIDFALHFYAPSVFLTFLCLTLWYWAHETYHSQGYIVSIHSKFNLNCKVLTSLSNKSMLITLYSMC